MTSFRKLTNQKDSKLMSSSWGLNARFCNRTEMRRGEEAK